jgi:hypothetical protein
MEKYSVLSMRAKPAAAQNLKPAGAAMKGRQFVCSTGCEARGDRLRFRRKADAASTSIGIRLL